MRRWISIYLKGIFMGTADMVPGVSGGTIALITGIYERLVTAITNADPRLLGHLARPHDADARAELADGLRRMDVGFLLALGAGIGTAVVAVSQVVGTLAESYPGLTAAFFFGLIGASAVVLARQVTVADSRTAAVVIVGVALAGSMAFLGDGSAPHALPLVFLSGMIAVSATILPGVSGAFFLLVLGQYYFMLDALTAFLDGLAGLVTGGSASAVADSAVVVVTFLAGATVGVLSIAHAVRWALDHHRNRTLAFLVALMVGGVLVPFREMASHVAGATGGAVGTASAATAVALSACAGGGAVLALDHFTDDLEYAENDRGGNRGTRSDGSRESDDGSAAGDERSARFEAATDE